MEQTTHTLESLAELLDASNRPIYAVDQRREIVYCNRAVAEWLGLESPRIVGRYVEYHSEEMAGGSMREASVPLTGLCPPPQALAGVPCTGTVGCVARGGRLVHRHADFVPLLTAGKVNARHERASGDGQSLCGVLVLLAATDMTPQELSAELSDEPTADELHRVIRRFRRGRAAEYALESLLGTSSAMQKVRAQVTAAAASQVKVLVHGRRGSGRGHIARAIHYQSVAETGGRLLPIECEVAGEEMVRRTLDSIRNTGDAKGRTTLLLVNLERATLAVQSQLLSALADNSVAARFVATMADRPPTLDADDIDRADETAAAAIDSHLLDALLTIRIDVPPLAERLEDLPLLAQCFLELRNRGSAKQIGSVRPDALDLLALYHWPGELDELRGVIEAAHAACATFEIAPADLPTVVHHAAKAAALPRRTTERIVLDELLATIEREVILRAMAQAGGNKSAAAELLGMTRPRLYRRLVQLGLAQEGTEIRGQNSGEAKTPDLGESL